MAVEIQIPDSDLAGFTAPARQKLEEATSNYASQLIEEANRIEAGRNSAGGSPEVTGGMVNDAQTLLRRGLGAPKKKIGTVILRVSAAVLSLVAGIMYDNTKLQDSGYMMLFILVVSAAILTVTLSAIKD